MNNEVFRLEIDERQMQKMQYALRKYPEECNKGLASALNKTLSKANTVLQNGITSTYNIKKQDLTEGNQFRSESSKNLLKLHKAKPQDLSAGIIVRSSRLSFNVKRNMVSPTEPKSHRGKTMKQIKRIAPPKVKVRKGKSIKFKHGFVAKGKGNTVALFSREKDDRRMKMHHTLSTVHMTKEQDIRRKAQTTVDESLSQNVEREINFRLEKVRQ